MTLETRQVRAGDFPALLELNRSEIPRVNLLETADMAWFAELTDWFYVCEEAGELAGFIIGLPGGLPYTSMNYQWFNDRYDSFLYNDRIVTSPGFRRRGVLRLLYGRLQQEAEQAGLERICCEVNLRPENSISLAAHARLGFTEAGRQVTEGGTKEVSLLVLEISAGR